MICFSLSAWLWRRASPKTKEDECSRSKKDSGCAAGKVDKIRPKQKTWAERQIRPIPQGERSEEDGFGSPPFQTSIPMILASAYAAATN
jgi:hypothetical protein